MPAEYRIGSLTRTRPDGSKYRHRTIAWVDERGPHRLSLGTDDRAAAEAAARAFWARRKLAATDTVGEIMSGYLAATEGTKPHKRHKEAWKAARSFWERQRPGLIDAAMCQSYAVQRARADNTIRNELSAIRCGLKWAKVKPAEALWMPPIPDSSVDHLSKAQFRKFIAGCKAPHVRLFAALAVATGGRSTALRQLTWDRVDLERRQLALNPRGQQQVANKGKATVPINAQLYPLLLEAKAGALSEYVVEHHGGPIASIRKGFEAASERTGIHCTPHMLRHSAAVWMAEARTPMEEIAAYLGHKGTAITIKTYARFHPDYLQRAAKALTW